MNVPVTCERCYEDRPELVPCADDTSEHCERCCESCPACAGAFWAEQDAEANRRDRTGDL